MKGDAGKWAERQVQEWLVKQSNADWGFAFHRFPDARAAQGQLASQPSDHLVVHMTKVSLLETKETAQKLRLPKKAVSQFGALYKFHLAGAGVAVIVHRSVFKDWLIFTNRHLFDHDEVPASFPFEGLTSYPSAAAALEALYQ